MSFIEPILQENKNRFVIFPIQHHDLWDWYKKQEASIWTAEEEEVKPLNSEELKQLLLQSKDNPDDCLTCGS